MKNKLIIKYKKLKKKVSWNTLAGRGFFGSVEGGGCGRQGLAGGQRWTLFTARRTSKILSNVLQRH